MATRSRTSRANTQPDPTTVAMTHAAEGDATTLSLSPSPSLSTPAPHTLRQLDPPSTRRGAAARPVERSGDPSIRPSVGQSVSSSVVGCNEKLDLLEPRVFVASLRFHDGFRQLDREEGGKAQLL